MVVSEVTELKGFFTSLRLGDKNIILSYIKFSMLLIHQCNPLPSTASQNRQLNRCINTH